MYLQDNNRPLFNQRLIPSDWSIESVICSSRSRPLHPCRISEHDLTRTFAISKQQAFQNTALAIPSLYHITIVCHSRDPHAIQRVVFSSSSSKTSSFSLVGVKDGVCEYTTVECGPRVCAVKPSQIRLNAHFRRSLVFG